MRRLLCALALLCAACGGPSAPSPTYPNLVGGYTGTMDVTVIANGVPVGLQNQCGVAWLIQSQNGGDFTGAFEATPNAVTFAPCPQRTSFSGKFSNIVPPGLQPSDFDVVALPADTPPGCTLISQTPLHGVWSQYGNASLLSLLGWNRFQCGTQSPYQSIRFTLSRR